MATMAIHEWLPSPSRPLLPASSSMAAFAATAVTVPAVAVSPAWPAHTLWSVVEKACALPRIERPGEKGGDGIFVERTLQDAFLPFNATLSAVRSAAPRTLAALRTRTHAVAQT